tara:strand:+ start:280 stop:1536 length:1257 start_codon:yes stop_codon:yes gene_type:complete
MELSEKNLSRATRRKMAKKARQTAKKRAIKRKARAKKMKTRGQLKSASEKMAKNILVKKMTGGKKYNQLSIGQKEIIDKKLSNKPGLIKKVARKVFPKIKAKEKERIKKARLSIGESTTESHGVFTLRKGEGELKISARYKNGKLVPYKFKNKTDAKKHSDKVGGKVYETNLGNFYVEFTKLDGPVNEKATSKSQQRLFGMVHAYNNGDLDKSDVDGVLYSKIKKIASGMSKNDAKKIAKTKHDDLPEESPTNEGTKYSKMNENKDADEDLKNLKSMLDIAQLLSDRSPYFKGRGGKKEYIKMLLHKIKKLSESHEKFLEIIKVPIEIGDTVLGGKFKNKKMVVKSIEKNEKGDITINKKPLLKFRITKQTESRTKKQKPLSSVDAYKQVRKPVMPKSRPMKNKKAYDRKDLKKGKYD